jgi:hypothetical protein
MQTFAARGTVEFGPLGIHPDGLSRGSLFLPWEDVSNVQVKEGHLAITRRDMWRNWCNIPVSQLPNVPVLLEMLGNKVRS